MPKLNLKKRMEPNLDMSRVLVKVGEGRFRYVDGVSDETLAEKYEVAKASVAYQRLEVFGKLENVLPPPGNSNEKMERLREHINGMCEQLGYPLLEW